MNEKPWEPWRLTIETYIGPHRLEAHPYATPTSFEMRTAKMTRGYPFVRLSENDPDYEIHTNRSRSFHIRHLPTNTWVGMDMQQVAHIDAQHRGKGLMAEVIFIMDQVSLPNRSRRGERHLTPESFAALRHAHALHVDRAIKAGLPVPEEVRAQYKDRPNGGIELVTPFGPYKTPKPEASEDAGPEM